MTWKDFNLCMIGNQGMVEWDVRCLVFHGECPFQQAIWVNCNSYVHYCPVQIVIVKFIAYFVSDDWWIHAFI